MKVFLVQAAMTLAPTLAALIALSAAGFTADQSMTTEPITSISGLKSRAPDTLIVRDGVPMAEIVIPAAKEYRALGEQVRDAIKSASDAECPIRRDSEFNGEYGVVRETPSKNVIVVGNMETSNLIALLYARKQCCEDAIYPGEGGYSIRTVCDPWGNGCSVIILGGSGIEGVRDAVDAFCDSIADGRTLRHPNRLRTEFSSAFIERFRELGDDPSGEYIAQEVAAADKSFRAGVHSGVFPKITAAGFSYLRTGSDGYARLFRDLLFLAYDLYKQNLGTYGGPWGMDADFKFADLIATWDAVEESPALSNDDRLKLTNIILEYIRYWEDYWSIKPVLTPGLRNNHTTFTSLGFMFAADYFGRHYKLPQSAHWMAMADGCFRSQAESFKPQEDSNSYQWLTLHHMLTYALARPDPTFITSGKARIGADLAIMTMDNLGYQVSFGDVGSFHGGNVEMYIWRPLAAVERDGRYMWAYRKGYEVRPLAGMNAYQSSTAPAEPRDLLGVKWLPTDPLFYRHFKGGEVPQERTFEKITFRTSFDAQKPYMILDGISGCGHGHSDGNSVLRLTDKGRIWIGDCDYIKAQPKFHNMLSVFRDGQSLPLPTFSEREIVADLDRVALTRTRTSGCSGTDWTRNVFWGRDSMFVFIDEVEAKVEDDFSIRCFWQTLGTPKLDGSAFTVEQSGPSCTITNLDGARLRTWDDPVTGKNWAAYKQAEPVVHVLQQIKTGRMKAFDKVCFLNVISTQEEGRTPPPAQRVGASSVILGAGKDRSLIGVSQGGGQIAPGLISDCGSYWLNRKYIALGNVTKLSLNGRALLSADKPVSAELAAGGKITISAEQPVTVSVPAGAKGLRLNGKPVRGRINGGLTSAQLPVGRSVIEGASTPSEFATSFPAPQPAAGEQIGGGRPTAGLSVASEFRAGRTDSGDRKITSVSTLGDGIYVGCSDGRVCALSSGGEVRWEYDAGSEVRALWAGRLSGDQGDRIAVGTAASMVYLLDGDGNLLWKKELPYYKRTASVVYFSDADLAGDGNRALIAGSENWHHYAFDSEGRQLWEYESVHASTAGAPVDLDGDGRQEFIAGTEYYWWHGVAPDGKRLWQYRTPTGPRATCVAAGDATGEGKPTVFFGGADGNIHAVSGEGTLLWQYSTGDEIAGLALADLDGDGRPEIVAGSLSFNVVAVKGDGKKLWRADIGEPVKALALADMDGDGAVEICAGTEDGRVVVLARDGRIAADWDAPAGVKRLAVVRGARERLACVTADGQLAVLEMR